MSSLEQAVVQASQGVQVTFDRSVVGPSAFMTLFTVPLAEPARIEAVWFHADFSGGAVSNELLVLQLALSDGTVVFTQPTPYATDPDQDTMICSFARGNNDSMQLSGLAHPSSEAEAPPYVNPPLPPLVLPALSTVSVALFEIDSGNSGSCTILNPTVTYTPGGAGTSVTEVVLNTQPILVAGTSG